jgi:hypothetical protein
LIFAVTAANGVKIFPPTPKVGSRLPVVVYVASAKPDRGRAAVAVTRNNDLAVRLKRNGVGGA